MKITPEQRAELKALAAAATPGPWKLRLDWMQQDARRDPSRAGIVPISGPKHVHFAEVVWKLEDDDRSPTCEATAKLVAAAREAIPALLADLEEAETAYDTTYEVWQRTELQSQELKSELAATRKQLAESQAIAELAAHRLESARHYIELQQRSLNRHGAIGVVCEEDDPLFYDDFRTKLLAMDIRRRNPSALSAAIAEAVAPYKRNAERYQYLREIGVMLDGHDFLSAGEVADNRIDAAMAAKEDTHG